MEKYQPNLEISLKFLKDNPKAKYVLPTSAYGTISHPKYKIFNYNPSIVVFTCKENETCYFQCESGDSKNLFLENSFLSLKNMSSHLSEYTFYIENFNKFGLHCCGDTWLILKKRFEDDFKDQNNIVFLWPNDDPSNT